MGKVKSACSPCSRPSNIQREFSLRGENRDRSNPVIAHRPTIKETRDGAQLVSSGLEKCLPIIFQERCKLRNAVSPIMDCDVSELIDRLETKKFHMIFGPF